MGAFLSAEKIEKHFDGTPVLRAISFQIEDGECIALLGESGCGKTTMLNVVAGFLRADGGRLVCGGTVLDDGGKFLPVHRREFAMVFQDFSLWPHMTIGENVAFGLRMRGVARAERERRATDALRRVGLDGRAADYPAQLSGGQQQRVAIARALVVEPRLLLFDEPLSALDPQLRDGLREEIGSLLRQLGIASLYVTHDQIEALTLARRVAVMRAGIIEQLATPETIYRTPATAYVARFLGMANIIPPGWSALPPTRARLETHAMLRREAVRVTAEAEAAKTELLSVNGACLRCDFLGERYEVALDCNGISLRGYARERIEPGRPAMALFPPEALTPLSE